MNIKNVKRQFIAAIFFALTALAASAFAQDAVNVADDVVAGDDVVVNDGVVADDNVVNNDNAVTDVADDNVVNNNNIVNDNVAADDNVVNNDVTDTTSTTTTPARRGIDLDRLLSDDEYADLFDDPVEEVADTTVTNIADGDVADTTVTTDISADQTADMFDDPILNITADTAAAQDIIGDQRRGAPPERAAVTRAAAADVVIEDGRTINFAQNLRGYRSPRIAMLLSLLVPGLGQAYSRNYTKAAAFGAAELTAIGFAVYFNAVSRSKRDDAYDFADRHFSVEQMDDYATRLNQAFETRVENATTGDDSVALIMSWETAIAPYNQYFLDAAKSRSTSFYTSIGESSFTPGWEDNEPGLDIIFGLQGEEKHEGRFGTYELTQPNLAGSFYLITRVVNGVRTDNLRGYSNYQMQYNDMLDESKSYRNLVNYMFYAMIVNHIASAVDAGFTARAYNARLLNEESVWDRVSVEQQYVFTGSELSPGIALRIRF